MIDRVVVWGAGTMGQGIAQVAALADLETQLFDLDGAALDRARTRIAASVAKGIEKGKTPPEARDRVESKLSFVTGTPELSAVDCVIEAVPESLELKVKVFQEIAAAVRPDCILATNTSSLPVTEIAAQVPGPERVVGMHFFNPVPIMKLIEIVRGLETSEESVERTLDLSRRMGKEPIVVSDAPGFATSRLGLALGLEAIRMLETGVATAQEIDKAMELGYRHPMGPLRLTDLVGLDVRLAIAEHLQRELGDRFRPPALLRKMVRAGRLGQKAGRGFYDWET